MGLVSPILQGPSGSLRALLREALLGAPAAAGQPHCLTRFLTAYSVSDLTTARLSSYRALPEHRRWEAARKPHLLLCDCIAVYKGEQSPCLCMRFRTKAKASNWACDAPASLFENHLQGCSLPMPTPLPVLCG